MLAYDDIASSGTSSKSQKIQPSPPSFTSSVSSASVCYDLLALSGVGVAVIIPSIFDQPYFMWCLLAPHVLAFGPLLLSWLMPEGLSHMEREPSFPTAFGGMVILLAVATSRVLSNEYSFAVVFEALYEHPAVSSVGWDVLCCWVSFATWKILK